MARESKVKEVEVVIDVETTGLDYTRERIIRPSETQRPPGPPPAGSSTDTLRREAPESPDASGYS